MARREYKRAFRYTGENLNYIAYPLGGIGSGMLCMEGGGGLTSVSIRHKPELQNSPWMFSAFCMEGRPESARLIEGRVPNWKIYGQPEGGNGLPRTNLGFPRCHSEYFSARFPFASVLLDYPESPLKIEVTGWSPFIPGDADNSSMPVAAIEYTFINNSSDSVRGVYSFHSNNFLAQGDHFGNVYEGCVKNVPGGFMLYQPGSKDEPWKEGAFCASVPGEETSVDCRWFRGGWFDKNTMLWQSIEKAEPVSNPPFRSGQPSPGGSLYVPVNVPAGGKKNLNLLISWYVPESNLAVREPDSRVNKSFYAPWYAGRFKDAIDVCQYWQKNYDSLKEETKKFTDCLYRSSVPFEILDAVASNLSILKSTTILRQKDGRLWCWEGSSDHAGCCQGSCTHVWNYAQAFAHLFPELERSLRQTEFNENQDENGHQDFRSLLPIRPTLHQFHSAADGQLGGIMKVYRDWRISGDTEWLRGLWEKVKKSLNYCIETWDPEHRGFLQEPHHNTYDIEFWGPDGMCTSFYIGALKAADIMGETLNDNVPLYRSLYRKGKKYMETRLFNGEYFEQDIRWKDLNTPDPTKEKDFASIEAMKIIRKEGPKYQYGKGCLSDGILGAWLGLVCGLDSLLDDNKMVKHLTSVFRYNFRKSLLNHVNPQRPGFANGDDGGLLLCTWPRGGKPSLPLPYSEEVWTGIEYQVASHLMMYGRINEAVEIIRTARARYDGKKRNPFNEYECGNWYGRALSSYGLLQGFSGIRYDALEKILYVKPPIKGDFTCFICTEKGYGLAGIKNGEPFLKVFSGDIEVTRIDYKKACDT